MIDLWYSRPFSNLDAFSDSRSTVLFPAWPADECGNCLPRLRSHHYVDHSFFDRPHGLAEECDALLLEWAKAEELWQKQWWWQRAVAVLLGLHSRVAVKQRSSSGQAAVKQRSSSGQAAVKQRSSSGVGAFSALSCPRML